MKEHTIAADDDGRRLDRVLRKAYPTVPPGALAGAVRRGDVRINGKRARNDTRVVEGDTLRVPEWSTTDIEEAPRGPSGPDGPPPRFNDNRIIFDEWSIPVLKRSEDWIAVNKPAGLASHGEGGLDEIIRAVARDQGWWAESMSFRPGPVHRLDRNTSGVQLFSLSTVGAQYLTEQIRKRLVTKLYVALVSGYLPRRTECRRRMAYNRNTRTAVVEPDEGPAERPELRRLRFSSARTHFFPLAFTADRRVGLVAAVPETGRTHQVRCHAAAMGIPLLGDTKYGGDPWEEFDPTHDILRGDERYILHAALFATKSPPSFWTAPFAPHTYGLLRNRFGDLSSVEHRLNEILPAVCTGCPSDTTIRV